MIYEFIKDVIKLVLIALMMFFLLRRYIRHTRPHLAESVEKHRLNILLVLGILLVGIKVSEDAITGDSGPADKAILLFVHTHLPNGFTGFFQAITLTGSFKVLGSLLVISSVVFLACKRRFEVWLQVCSMVAGALVIYTLKNLTERQRPELWETRWYWGTSFPSGHTLGTACFAMSLALGLSRVWPEQAILIRLLGLFWVLLVGCSRLVLGVHWPTDVLAAACIGLLLPVSIQFLLRFRFKV